MTLKDSWSHFIFHICKCLLEFATRGKHDVRALDVFLGEQSLRSGSFAFQGDTECSEAVQGDSVALGKMLGQAVEDFLQHRFHHAVWEKAEMFRHFLYEFLMRNRFVGHTLCVCSVSYTHLDYNSFEKPNVVAPKEFTGAKVNKGSLKVTLPAKSIVVLEVK